MAARPGLTRIPADTGSALSADVTVLHGVAYVTVIPVDATGDVVAGGIAAQSEQIFVELERELARVGSGLDRIAHLTVYLRDIEGTRLPFNEVYARRMPLGSVPVRCAVGIAALARPEMLVEVTALAEAGGA